MNASPLGSPIGTRDATIVADLIKGSDHGSISSRNCAITRLNTASPGSARRIPDATVVRSSRVDGNAVVGSKGSKELGKRWGRAPTRTGGMDLEDAELPNDKIQLCKSLTHPIVFRDLAVIASCALCNVAFGMLILFVVNAIKLTFGVVAIMMCITSMFTFVFETSSRPYSYKHYAISLIVVPTAMLSILLLVPEGNRPKEFCLNTAAVLVFGQLWGVEVYRYFASTFVMDVYREKKWKIPKVTHKVLYFFIALTVSAIAITPIMWIIPYVLWIWSHIRSLHVEQAGDIPTYGNAPIYEVLIILHMPILKLALDMIQRRILTKLLEMVSAATVNYTLMAFEGFTTLAIKFLVVSSSFHIGIAAGISAQLIQTLTTAFLIRHAYNDLSRRMRGDREVQLRRLRILMQCAHGDMLLQLQSILVSCIAKYNIQKDDRFIEKYGTASLEDYELVVIALAQILPIIICNYFLLAYMVRVGLVINIYGGSVKETLGAVVLSIAFPMFVFLFFVFA